MTASLKIAISGAGVAGPALAYWLHRTGHQPLLIEQAPQFRTGGYVVDFWGVGYQVCERMGIEVAIREAGYQVQSVCAVDDEGKVQARLKTALFERLTGGKFTSVPRGDLAAAIYAQIEGKVETIFGDSIAAVDQQNSNVHLSFERGADRDVDLLIGADGLHSNVRRLVFGPESAFERYLGCNVAACVVDDYRPRDELVYMTHNAPGRQIARFTLRGNRTLFLFVFRAKEAQIPHAMDAQKAMLRREFAGAGWESGQILDALEGIDDLYFDVVSQIHMDRWSKDRTLLIGDAAACISLLGGEGTGLAITEAYVLAGELHRANGDYRKAYEAYEAKLRPLIKDKQAGAEKFISFFATRTRFGIWFRNQAMRAMNLPPFGKLFVRQSLRDDIDLPDYGI